jgi:hypothetical protein
MNLLLLLSIVAKRRPARGVSQEARPFRWRRALRAGIAIAVASSFAGSSLSHGQALPDDIRPGEPLQDRFDRRQPAVGAQIGAVRIRPEAYLGFGFDDNIFATRDDKKSDFFALYGGRIAADYAHETLRAQFTAGVTDRRYVDRSSEDYWQAQTRLSVSDQLFNNFAIFSSGGVQRLAVPRDDPNGINGLKPATYMLYDAFAGVRIGSPLRNLVTLSAGIDQTRYASVEGLLGPINTRERDRREIFGNARVDHSFFGRQSLFAEIRPDSRTYGQEIDNSGFRRASNGIRATLGMTFDINTVFYITASGGYQARRYADPRYGSNKDPDHTLDVRWMPTLLTSVEGKFVHEYAEDIFGSSPGFIRNKSSLSIDHELRRDVLLSFGFSYDMRKYERVPNRFNILSAFARVQHQLADGFTVGLSYVYAHQTSNTSHNYTSNNILLDFKKKF